jgi:hypothetical protein
VEAYTGETESGREETILPIAYPVFSIAETPAANLVTFVSCLGLIILSGAVLGGVCGSGFCSRNELEPSTTTSRPPIPPMKKPQYRSFTTTDELYQAVDTYILGLTEDPKESIAARVYGYPIGTWDVSQIKDFSQVFDPERNSTFDLIRPPSVNSSFNEDINGWNVSAAESMFGMFFSATSCEYLSMRSCFAQML